MAVNKLTITHLYPQEMNIYGDNGNLKVLVWRLERRGFKAEVKAAGVGQKISQGTDILLGGGGQDSGQSRIKDDLAGKAKELKALVEDGAAALMVCGMYQLFGHYFETETGEKIAGISVFDAVTQAGNTRLIGNVVASSPFGRLVGFENHSGQTTLGDGQLPLAKIIKGHGNNQSDGKEGAVTMNAIGTYLHGPLLPKNPQIADELIRRALERRAGGRVELEPLDDRAARRAADTAARRP